MPCTHSHEHDTRVCTGPVLSCPALAGDRQQLFKLLSGQQQLPNKALSLTSSSASSSEEEAASTAAARKAWEQAGQKLQAAWSSSSSSSSSGECCCCCCCLDGML